MVKSHHLRKFLKIFLLKNKRLSRTKWTSSYLTIICLLPWHRKFLIQLRLTIHFQNHLMLLQLVSVKINQLRKSTVNAACHSSSKPFKCQLRIVRLPKMQTGNPKLKKIS